MAALHKIPDTLASEKRHPSPLSPLPLLQQLRATVFEYRQPLIFQGTQSTELGIYPSLSTSISCWIMGRLENLSVSSGPL